MREAIAPVTETTYLIGGKLTLVYDCPECKDWGSVFLFVVFPSIWKCQKCHFLFEPRELIRYQHHPDF